MRIAALVLAAGVSARFGSPKALARLDGKPLLQHVLDAVAAVGLARVDVVLGHAAGDIEAAIDWRDEVRIRNPDPARGLSSSLRDGLADLAQVSPRVDAALILLGDQPRTSPDVIRALLRRGLEADAPFVAPRYVDGGGPHPLFARRDAFRFAREVVGDRGLGPVLNDHPDLVEWVDVPGRNPDVDTPRDLARLAAETWADRVRANREQVDRVREVPDGTDFYAPVSALFRADPRRSDDQVLDALRRDARPGETWLDIGAGAGRFALPLALVVGKVIALDPSVGMLDALREQMTAHGIGNVRPIEGRWPPDAPLREALGPDPVADVALIAHVGYDVEEIGRFLDAMEAASRRLCLAVLMERQPASLAEAFWPPVHGEERVPLPGLPEFADLLRARGSEPVVEVFERQPRRFESREELERFLRRQLWIADGGEKERRFHRVLEELLVEDDGRFGLAGQHALGVGVLRWVPRG